MAVPLDLTHSERRLSDPPGWVFYLSHEQPERLVAFVHGFGGQAVKTWQRFPASGQTRGWWRTSDMLFVGYDSKRDTILGTASRLRRELPRFFPQIPDEVLAVQSARVRAPSEGPYREFFLIGHSLGGLVIRRALCDAADEWIDQRRARSDAPRPRLLEADVRLFSPASAGFRAAGLLGLLQATSAWSAANMYLRRSSAFTDLQPGSPVLQATKERTERLVHEHADEVRALRARIVWANPDDVVISERYHTDHADDAIDGTNHRSVCKPHTNYETPWTFVETGQIR